MWKLGNLEINSKVVLGPMAGYTSEGYRDFFASFNPGLMYTEMISDMGLIYSNQETLSYLASKKSNIPLGIQLFGSDPENILKAANIAKNISKQIDFIDINMGCPVPKVTKTGAGSALLKEPKKCAEIIKILKDNFDIPITAKIRLGWDEKSINYLEVIKCLENAGVDMICIHARTKKELYYGTPHFDLLKDLRLQMHVPLIISGNIFTLDDAINALDITKADAVMVARGSIGNPTLIRQINEYYNSGERINEPSFYEQKQYCLDLAKCLINEKGEKNAMLTFRSIATRFFTGYKEVKKLNIRLATELNSYQDLVNIIDDYEKNVLFI